jgi:hypothetical protein
MMKAVEIALIGGGELKEVIAGVRWIWLGYIICMHGNITVKHLCTLNIC